MVDLGWIYAAVMKIVFMLGLVHSVDIYQYSTVELSGPGKISYVALPDASRNLQGFTQRYMADSMRRDTSLISA